MPRKKKDEKNYPDPTPDKELTQPSGWCITDHHSNCRYEFDHGKCGCKCHKQGI